MADLSAFDDIAMLRPRTKRYGQKPPSYHVRTKPIDTIDIHTTATPEGSPRTWESIEHYHTNSDPRGNAYGRGWWCGAYHYLIHIDGTITMGLPHEWIGWSGVNNSTGISVCYVGGMDAAYKRPKDTRTSEQRHSMFRVVHYLRLLYGIPESRIIGHNEVANKACPCFPWDYERGLPTGHARDDYVDWLDANPDLSAEVRIGDALAIEEPSEPSRPAPVLVPPLPPKPVLSADELTGIVSRALRGDAQARRTLEMRANAVFNALRSYF